MGVDMENKLGKMLKSKHPIKKGIANGGKNISKSVIVPAIAVKTVTDGVKGINEDNGQVYGLRDKQTFHNGIKKVASTMKNNNNDEDKKLRLALLGALGLAGASTVYNIQKGTLKKEDLTGPGKQILRKVNPVYRNFNKIVNIANRKKITAQEVQKLKYLFNKYRASGNYDLTFDGFAEMYQMYKSEKSAFRNIGDSADDFFDYVSSNKNRFRNMKKQQGSRKFEQDKNPIKAKFDKEKFMKDIKSAIGLGSMSAAAGLGWNASKDIYDSVAHPSKANSNNKNNRRPYNTNNNGNRNYNQRVKNQPRRNGNGMNKMAYDFTKMKNVKDKVQKKVLDKDFVKQDIVGNTLNSIAYTTSGALAFKMLNRDRNDFSKLDTKKKKNNGVAPVATKKTIIELPEDYMANVKPSKEILKTASDIRSGKKILNKTKDAVKKIFPEDMPKQLAQSGARGITRTVPIAALAGATGRNFQGNMERFDSEEYRQNTLAPLERGNIRITVEKFDSEQKSPGSVK